jgi:uncharacterized membrane protein (TIGR02234 family)
VTRSRRAVIVLTLLGAGLILLSASRTWATVRLTGALGVGHLPVGGRRELPAAIPVALAAVAAAVVLGIAGRALRVLVATGLAIAAVVLGLAAARAGQDTFRASSLAVRHSLGLIAAKGVDAEVFDNDTRFTFWPWVAVGGAGLIALAGLIGMARGWSWPVSGRRFERPGPRDGVALGQASDLAAPPGRPSVMAEKAAPRSTWDALSRGEDPTSTGDDPT